MMRELRDLGLTSNQMGDVLAADPLLVSAWLDRLDDPVIDNPTAFFIVGVRSGVMPVQLESQRHARASVRAERWIRNAGLFMPDETNLLSELFDPPAGMLRHFRDYELLRARMLALYHEVRPTGEEVERDFAARMARGCASREKTKEENHAG
jgi:hypothetical protein